MTESRHSPQGARRPSRWNTLLTSMFGGVVDGAVGAAVTAQRAEFDIRMAASTEPMLAWIRGAEAHLAALQADHDRLKVLYEERMAQLDRLAARAIWLEARLEDLERADTAIAGAIARSRIRDEFP